MKSTIRQGKIDINLSLLLMWMKAKMLRDSLDMDIMHYVRAYLLYLIGSIILLNTSKATVPVLYLQLFGNVDIINQYVWSAALLVNLHFYLQKLK